MGGAWGLLLLLLGVVRCAAAWDNGGTELSVGNSSATSPDDQPQSSSPPPEVMDAEERDGMGEGTKMDEKGKDGLEIDEGLAEDDHGTESLPGPTSPSASGRMLFVGKDSALPLATNVTTNRTRDLLTWRLKDQTRIKDLTNKILASVKDQWRRNEEFGILKKHPHDVGASDGQSEAGSQVVERRVAPPKHFSRSSGRLSCTRRRCKPDDETLELRRRLMHDLQSSFSSPLPSRIRYRLKKKPSIYTSKKPSTRLDIGVPDIYESEVSITPKLRRRPPTRRTQDGHSNEFGFAADKKFQQFMLPEAQQHVALEALVTPDHTAANDETSTQTYIPLSSVPGVDRPSSLVYRPPRRPPGSQRRRTSGLLRRPSPAEPHYFTTPSSLQHLNIQAHLPYRRPVSFRYSRTSAASGPIHSTSPAPKIHQSIITGQDKSKHVTSVPSHSSTASAAGHVHPSQKYLPPNKEYIPPKGTSPKTGEGATRPSVHYVPPENEYIPPKIPHKPTTDPKPSTEPPRTYQPPTKEYIPPESPHQTPIPKEPPRKYLPPHQDYKAPTEQSEEPHSQPPRKYLPPNKEYEASKTDQGDVFPPPSKEYQSPKIVSEVPSRYYLLPNKDYKIPIRRPHRPSSEQKTPATGYPEPPRKYLPPDKNFGSDGRGPGGRRPPPRRRRPSKRRRKNRKRPTPPGRKYLPPNKEYIPPQSDPHLVKETGNEPSKTYQTPDKEYLPPKDYTSSHTDSVSATTVTVPSYTVPSRTYLPPHLDHSTAAPSFVTSTPPSGYVPPHLPTPPTSFHKRPHSGYSPPTVTYEPPVRTYQPPTKNYIPPQGTTLPGWLQSIKTDHASSSPGHPEVYVSRFPPPLKIFADHHTSPITTPQPSYTPPVRTYQPPVNEYLPPTLTSAGPPHHATTPKPVYTGPPPPPLHRPLDPAYLPVPKRPSTHYLPPHADYQSPEHGDATHPTATPKPHYITIILPPETSPKPDYVPPSSPKKNYVPPSSPKPENVPSSSPKIEYVPPSPPKKEYVPPSSPKPDYIPPSSPKPDYVPPSSPKPDYVPPKPKYVPPSSPKPDYVPPSSPKPDYVPPSSPKPDYVPPSSPKPDYVPPSSPKPDYVPPSSPKPDYVPPSSPKPDYVPPSSPKKEYVPPSSPKPDYVPPSSPKPQYVPPKISTPKSPLRRPPAHVTTYRPSQDPKVQKLQDFSHPGKGRPSRPTSAPVYFPTTAGPGYNDLPPHITGHHPLTPRPFIEDYYDDDYYYYDDDDDYYYSYDDDYYYDYDDYYDYYYYYDDYDYGPYSAPLRTPFQLTFQDDYDIHESDILEYGYIAGIPGRAGRDYPILSYIPLTSFGCDLVADYPGYYADMEAGCQVFHICHRSGRQDSFLCPNGTVFNQKYFVCDWWYNFACEDAPFFYPVNAAIGQPGVPLHRNAFEPDLRVVHSLPPLHKRPRPQPQPRPATPITHHPDSLSELVTLAPLPPELVHAALG